MSNKPFDSLSGQYDKELQRDYFDLCIITAYDRAFKREITQAKAFENLVRCYEEFFSPKEARESAREDFNAYIDFVHDSGGI
jgi:hypothetical protein